MAGVRCSSLRCPTNCSTPHPPRFEEVAPGQDREYQDGTGDLIDGNAPLGEGLDGVVGVEDRASGEERRRDPGGPEQAGVDRGRAQAAGVDRAGRHSFHRVSPAVMTDRVIVCAWWNFSRVQSVSG